ncbi:MAG: FHA domain-containing protein [Nannocystaceae bacterium]|jgi:pSer/pThr/pTyr-binding forkhead associated (FHA) protein
MPRFRFKIGGKTVLLPEGQHDVGRMAGCWLVLDDDLVSRTHARFHVGREETEVEDLGSRNGTFLNGERIQGRRALKDGDRVRIGRELIAVLGMDTSQAVDGDEDLRRTLAPGEDTRFPSLIGQLVDKALKAGKIKDAERYAAALSSQLATARVPVNHPAAEACIRCLIQLADRTSSGVWIDRLFKLHNVQGWVMDATTLESLRSALDRIPRVPGRGLQEYEQTLKQLARDGTTVSPELLRTIAELADAYGGG